MKAEITSLVIRCGPRRRRRRPREGDRKTVNGVEYVRRQMLAGGCYVVQYGRPVFEWVKA